MKKLGIFALLILAGCKINVDEPVVQKSGETSTTAGTSGQPVGSTSGTTRSPGTSLTTAGTTGSTSGSKPPAGTTPVPKGTSGSTPAPPAQVKPSAPAPGKPETTADLKTKPGYNPYRIYQLSTFKTATLGINGRTLHTWIADNDSTREEGLMFVKDKDMTDDQSMIFVFPNASEQGFWMHNTYIPLDIAYIGKDKTVVSTATMKAFDETNVPSHGPTMYALEMKVGTLSRLGITKGTKIDIPDSVKAQDVAPPPPQPGLGGMPQ